MKVNSLDNFIEYRTYLKENFRWYLVPAIAVPSPRIRGLGTNQTWIWY